jgi:hypothetical protein
MARGLDRPWKRAQVTATGPNVEAGNNLPQFMIKLTSTNHKKNSPFALVTYSRDLKSKESDKTWPRDAT